MTEEQQEELLLKVLAPALSAAFGGAVLRAVEDTAEQVARDILEKMRNEVKARA